MRCAVAFGRGRASASIFSTCRSSFGLTRKRSIRTISSMIGDVLARPAGGAKDLRKLVRSRDLELIVAAIDWLFVRPPPHEHRGVPKSRPLHMVVLHLADALDPQRFPGHVF